MACDGEGNSHDVTLPRVCSQEHTHIRLTAFFPGLPRWAGSKKGKTNLDFTEARDSEWQWNQLGHIQVCTSLQTDNHASTPSLCFYRPDSTEGTVFSRNPDMISSAMWCVINRFTRARSAMMSCSTTIVHGECSVPLHTVKVTVSVLTVLYISAFEPNFSESTVKEEYKLGI